MIVDTYQFLASEFEVRTNSLELEALMGVMLPRASQDFAVEHRYVLTALASEGEYRISDDGAEEDFELTTFYAVSNLARRMYRRARANLQGQASLRAAIGIHAGRAFLLVGPRWSGKTTLALHLLFAGYEISGDNLTILDQGSAVAFPWKFIVSEATVELVPDLLKVHPMEAAYSVPSHDFRFATDPIDFGRAWHITPAEIGTIFYLEPTFGSRSEITRAGKTEIARFLTPACSAPPARGTEWLANLCRTVDRADTFFLRLGDLDSASAGISRVLG